MFSPFLAGSLVVRESRDRRDRISNKNTLKKKNIFGSEIDFSKVGVRIPFSRGNFHFLAAEKLTFWGGRGGITSQVARQ